MHKIFTKPISTFYSSLRGSSFVVDPDINTLALLSIGLRKVSNLARGLICVQRFVFVDRGVTLVKKHGIKWGKAVNLGVGVELQAIGSMGLTLGDFTTIDRNATIRCSGTIRDLGVGVRIGSHTSVGANNFIHGGGGVFIGSDCLLGPGVMIFSVNHVHRDNHLPIRLQGDDKKPVTIGNDVWIGAGSVILAGVTIGDGVVIAAGSVVTKDIHPFHVVAGIPAKTLRMRECE